VADILQAKVEIEGNNSYELFQASIAKIDRDPMFRARRVVLRARGVDEFKWVK
jgi:hypothetical protein